MTNQKSNKSLQVLQKFYNVSSYLNNVACSEGFYVHCSSRNLVLSCFLFVMLDEAEKGLQVPRPYQSSDLSKRDVVAHKIPLSSRQNFPGT